MQLEEDQKAFLPLLAYFWNLQNTLAKATKLNPRTIILLQWKRLKGFFILHDLLLRFYEFQDWLFTVD